MKRPEGIDDVIDKAVASRDPKTQKELINQASKLLYDDVTFIPFFLTPHVLIVRKEIHGFGLNEYAHAFNRWVNVWISKE